jgi:hypothetical protein
VQHMLGRHGFHFHALQIAACRARGHDIQIAGGAGVQGQRLLEAVLVQRFALGGLQVLEDAALERQGLSPNSAGYSCASCSSTGGFHARGARKRQRTAVRALGGSGTSPSTAPVAATGTVGLGRLCGCGVGGRGFGEGGHDFGHGQANGDKTRPPSCQHWQSCGQGRLCRLLPARECGGRAAAAAPAGAAALRPGLRPALPPSGAPARPCRLAGG